MSEYTYFRRKSTGEIRCFPRTSVESWKNARKWVEENWTNDWEKID
jgi:O-succinylbenzoate synthase